MVDLADVGQFHERHSIDLLGAAGAP